MNIVYSLAPACGLKIVFQNAAMNNFPYYFFWGYFILRFLCTVGYALEIGKPREPIESGAAILEMGLTIVFFFACVNM